MDKILCANLTLAGDQSRIWDGEHGTHAHLPLKIGQEKDGRWISFMLLDPVYWYVLYDKFYDTKMKKKRNRV